MFILTDKKYIDSLVILLILFIFPYTLLIKEFLFILNKVFFFNSKFVSYFNESIFFISRGLIILSFVIIFILNQRKFNKVVFLLFILNILFLYNFFFSDIIQFEKDFHSFFRENVADNLKINENNIFKSNYKIFLINAFNITFPLIICSITKIEINKTFFLKNFDFFYKIFFYFFLILFFYLCFNEINKIDYYYSKYYNLYQEKKGVDFFHYLFFNRIFDKGNFINFHILFSIFTLFIIHKLNLKINFFLIYKFSDKVLIISSFIFLVIFKAYAQLLILFIFFFILVFTKIIKEKKKFFQNNYSMTSYILLLIAFAIIIFLLIYLNYNKYNFNTSVLYRVVIFNYYFQNLDIINWIYGNSLMKSNMVVFPHNLFLDLIYFTGLIGLCLFIFILYKFLKITNYLTPLTSYFIILSFVSGFLFLNPMLNILLAVSLIQDE